MNYKIRYLHLIMHEIEYGYPVRNLYRLNEDRYLN